MAVKFTKTDDLDKMFEEFATLPKLEKVEFPDDKKKKEAEELERRLREEDKYDNDYRKRHS